MKRKRVTIAQVAREAGVSRTTVSFVYNKPGQIADETVQRVLRVAEELGYSPNPIARAMNLRSTGVIGLLVPFSLPASLTNPFLPVFMQAVSTICDEKSLSLLLVSPYKGSLEEATRRAPVDGYIVLGLSEAHQELEPLRRRQFPFVVVDGDAKSVSSINADDESGAYEAAKFLLEIGHRDILVLTFEQVPPTHMDNVYYGVGGRRLKGYLRAFAEYGLTLPSERLVPALTSVEGGAQAFRQVWESGARPTAVLAMSDAKAIGVLREAHRLGLHIPYDLEVIGFDDVPTAELVTPPLSTVHQPVFEKGQRAAELLIESLEEVQPPQKIELSTELILRETTRRTSHKDTH